MKAKLITIQQMVENVLRQYPGTREDDRELIQTLYGKYYGVDFYKPWGAVIRDKNLPSFESIRRCRQKVQELREDLRASAEIEQMRLDAQQNFIEYAKEA